MEALLPKPYWSVKNGYCLPRDADCMPQLSLLLSQQPDLASKLSQALRVGVQWDTQVGCDDMSRCPQRVCQVLCACVSTAGALTLQVSHICRCSAPPSPCLTAT